MAGRTSSCLQEWPSPADVLEGHRTSYAITRRCRALVRRFQGARIVAMAVAKRPSSEDVDEVGTDDDVETVSAARDSDENDETASIWEAWGLDPDMSQVTTREDVARDTYSRARRDALMKRLS